MKTMIKALAPNWAKEAYWDLKYLWTELSSADEYMAHLSGRSGIEIGGPSTFFRSRIPIYRNISGLDCVNFSDSTVWEGKIKEGRTFNYYRRKIGLQYIAEASNIECIPDGKYDFLLSSNCLEHLANPLKALKEWKRVVRPGGVLLVVVPNQKVNFDHRRKITEYSHLITDLKQDTGEDDLTHLGEILEKHDLSLDPPASGLENFERRSRANIENRCLHHHVFDAHLLERAMTHWQMNVLKCEEIPTDFLILAQV